MEAEQIPSVGVYDPTNPLKDLPAIKYAAAQFLDSNMIQSEEYCLRVDPSKERLYITAGYSLIQCLKALMSYEEKDLQEALVQLTHGNNLASKYRASSTTFASRLSGLVWGAPTVQAIRAMTPVQRHAELLYAETLMAKALIGTVCSGSWLGFIKEAMSFRTMINIYMALGNFLQVVDTESSTPENIKQAPVIDNDFRSGVELGVGASNLLLSLLPKSILSVAEVFGYQGNRTIGLELLMKAGGWSKDSPEPTVDSKNEGLRRPLADICLLVFHLVLSTFVFEGVDIQMAQIILDWNMRRFPKGVFFLFAQGRLRLLRNQPALAIDSYTCALTVQNQYRNLHYISYWETAICDLALCDVEASLQNWRVLQAEATWSKACYAYGMAVCLLELGGTKNTTAANDLLRSIPNLVQKIAGKSIPIEKFVARKARKFTQNHHQLVLPSLELGYIFQALNHAPRDILKDKMLPKIDALLEELSQSGAESRSGYWDDFCLVHLLHGVCSRLVAHPDVELVLGENEDINNTERGSASMSALRSFKILLENSDKITLEHWIIYHAHYELGRLYACMGHKQKARERFELVLSEKALEGSPKARKGKYSMQSALILRTTAAMEEISR